MFALPRDQVSICDDERYRGCRGSLECHVFSPCVFPFGSVACSRREGGSWYPISEGNEKREGTDGDGDRNVLQEGRGKNDARSHRNKAIMPSNYASSPTGNMQVYLGFYPTKFRSLPSTTTGSHGAQGEPVGQL